VVDVFVSLVPAYPESSTSLPDHSGIHITFIKQNKFIIIVLSTTWLVGVF